MIMTQDNTFTISTAFFSLQITKYSTHD